MSKSKNIKDKIIGEGYEIETAYGTQKVLYCDWTASGRLYQTIEDRLRNEVAPYVANTHTETVTTGAMMTEAYHQAREIIKKHVNAGKDDILIMCGSGMTSAINKLQRILGIRYPESDTALGRALNFKEQIENCKENKPVVFISHMEHHSNHTSWLETVASVEVIGYKDASTIDIDDLEKRLINHKDCENKIVSVTACSNVTGIKTPYKKIARIAHKHGAKIFVDFACSAPYVEIDMHPNKKEYLDAIFLSTHKFLGGPGTPGVLVFNKELYHNEIPDKPGGGTVLFTSPWGKHIYKDDIEEREDGGTPPFLQTIKAGMAFKLKEYMGVDWIAKREKKIVKRVMKGLKKIPNLRVFASQELDRLAVFSFLIVGIHYNLIAKMLNDIFGIQTRGGCACAGTYGHALLEVDMEASKEILNKLLLGDEHSRPGWVRASFHPTTTDEEIDYFLAAVNYVAENHELYKDSYRLKGPQSTEWIHVDDRPDRLQERCAEWFDVS